MNIQQLIKDGKIYSKTSNQFFDTYQEEKVPKADNIPFDWKGGLIPFDTYQEIVNFFLWTYELWKGESQVRLWYNTETQEWATYPMPQLITKGSMATTDSYCEKISKLFPPPWIDLGTGHHHCNANAFASAQDINNEQNQDGFHFTIGNLNQNKLDLHARFSWSGQLFPCHVSDFVAAPEWLHSAPDNTYYQILDIMLRTPPECPDFPKEWKQQVTEKITKPDHSHHIHHPYQGLYQGYNWRDCINNKSIINEEEDVLESNDIAMEISDIAYTVSEAIIDNPYDILEAFNESKPNNRQSIYIKDVESMIEAEIAYSQIKIRKKDALKETLDMLRAKINKDEKIIQDTNNLEELKLMTGASMPTIKSINYEIYENGISIEDLI